MRGRLVMVGAFPPPVHGMSTINACVRDEVRAMGAVPFIIDIAADTLDRSLRGRLSRLPKVLLGLAFLVALRRLRGGALYMSVSGGVGQLYELVFLLIARLRSVQPFLHHHSYAYLDRYHWLSQALMWLAGRSAVHVVLSAGMGECLRTLYGVNEVVPVTNAIFALRSGRQGISVRKRVRTALFIGNIAPEKGVFEYLDLMAAVTAIGLPIVGKLAGPFQDRETEQKVRKRLAVLPSVEYVGPKYEREKEALFSSVDVLVFPTRYANEADPLTIHEALACGVPVISYGRGAIPEIVGSDSGLVVDPEGSFISVALDQIKAWWSSPSLFEAASRSALAKSQRRLEESRMRWQGLLVNLVGEDVRRGKKEVSGTPVL